RRRSTTAKAGGCSVAAAMPVATLSAVATMKPRRSMARAKRWHSGASSSTSSRLRSLSGRPSSAEGPLTTGVVLCMLMSSFILCRLSHRRFAFHAFEHGSFPLNYDLCAAIRHVGEADARAGALQQALRNEDAEPHMLPVAIAAAG